jgi:hypothetical protein
MEIRRLSSEIAKLVARLSRSSKLPDGWTPPDLVKLVDSYRGLIEVQGSGSSPEKVMTFEDILQNGRPGSYEEMVERALSSDEQVRAKANPGTSHSRRAKVRQTKKD